MESIFRSVSKVGKRIPPQHVAAAQSQYQHHNHHQQSFRVFRSDRRIIISEMNRSLGPGSGFELDWSFSSGEFDEEHERRWRYTGVLKTVDLVLANDSSNEYENYRSYDESVVEQALENKRIVLEAASENGNILEFTTPDLKNDLEVVLAAVHQDASVWKHVSVELQRHHKVLETCQRFWKLLIEDDERDNKFLTVFIPERYPYEQMKELVLMIMDYHDDYFPELSDEMKRDKDIVMKAVRNLGWNYFHLEDENMKRDPDVINAAVLESACVIQLVPKDLITRELALEALLSWEIHAFEHIPERLVDYDLIYEACTINGMVLLFAPEEFRNDVPLQAAALHSIWDNPRYITKNGVEKAMNDCVRFIVSEGGLDPKYIIHPAAINGLKWNEYGMKELVMRDITCLEEVDEDTGLLPFMTYATDHLGAIGPLDNDDVQYFPITKDLSTLYEMIRTNPRNVYE